MSTQAKGGRKLHWSWSYFTKEMPKGKHVASARCKTCRLLIGGGHIDRMIKHLTNECKPLPAVVKNAILDKYAKENEKTERSTLKLPRTRQDEDDEEITIFGKNEQIQCNLDLTEALVTSGVQHSFVSNPAFVKFCQTLQPMFVLPSRQAISQKWITVKYDEIRNAVERAVVNSPFVTISCDGWSDVRKRSHINFIVHTPIPFLIKTIDTGTNIHTAEYISQLVIDLIEEIGPTKVTALMSDHAANIVGAFRIVNQRFPWIICLGCKAHCLHLACTDVLKIDCIAIIFEACKDIVKFFSRRTPNAMLLKAQMYHYGRKIRLLLPSNVRWGTAYAMFDSLINSIDSLLQVLGDPIITRDRALKEEAKRLLDFLVTNGNFQKIQEITAVLAPLSNAIKFIEGDHVKASEGYFKAMEAFEISFSHASFIQVLGQDTKSVIKQALRERKNFGYAPVYFLDAVLSPKDRGGSLSQMHRNEATRVFTEYIMRHPMINDHRIKAIQELAQWKSMTGIFADPSRHIAWELVKNENLEPETFWNGFYDDTLLSRVTMMLRPLSITSAANERVWSTRGFNHSTRRNSLSSETASRESYISYNLKKLRGYAQKPKDIFYVDVNSPNEQPSTSSRMNLSIPEAYLEANEYDEWELIGDEEEFPLLEWE